jgi:flagellar hook-associated protein 3 FlgL
MMMTNFMGNINRNMSLMEKYQSQLSSGRRMQRLSDDPIGIMSTLNAREKLSRLDMYNTSIEDAKSWLTQTETSLKDMNDVVTQVYQNTIYAAGGTMTTTDTQAVSELVKQLRQHITQLGNSTYGGRYIFGGYNTTSAPFQTDVSGTLLYNNVDLVTAPAAQTDALNAQIIRYSTGTNVTTDVSITGVDLMGTGADNIDKILSDLADALDSGASTDVLEPFVGKLQSKQQDVLSMLADIGGRANRLEMMSNANSDNEINYTEVLSKVEDIDQAQVTMDFKMAEAVYRSALEVGARVIQPSLLDFLR